MKPPRVQMTGIEITDIYMALRIRQIMRKGTRVRERIQQELISTPTAYRLERKIMERKELLKQATHRATMAINGVAALSQKRVEELNQPPTIQEESVLLLAREFLTEAATEIGVNA